MTFKKHNINIPVSKEGLVPIEKAISSSLGAVRMRACTAQLVNENDEDGMVELLDKDGALVVSMPRSAYEQFKELWRATPPRRSCTCPPRALHPCELRGLPAVRPGDAKRLLAAMMGLVGTGRVASVPSWSPSSGAHFPKSPGKQ